MGKIYEQEEASLDAAEVEAAIKRGRGEKTEFYPTLPDDPTELAISACSLANNGGGQIILGVNKSGDVVGVDDPDIESKVRNLLKTELEDRYSTKIVSSGVEIQSEDVYIFVINEYKKYPLMADGRFYIRHGDENILLNPERVARLFSSDL